MGTSLGIPGFDTTYFVVDETVETTSLLLNANLCVGTTHDCNTGRTYADIEQLRVSFDLLRERGEKALAEARGLMAKNCTASVLQALNLVLEGLQALDTAEKGRMGNHEHSG